LTSIWESPKTPTLTINMNKYLSFLLLLICLGLAPISTPSASAQDSNNVTIEQSSQAVTKFSNFQTYLKSWAVIILLIAIVIGALLGAMGKWAWAIGTMVGAIVLFGGSYLVALAQTGLK